MTNPYAPPKAELADDVHIDRAIIELRQKHLAHEASIGSAGMLFYVFGVLTTFSGVVAISAMLEPAPDLAGIAASVGIAVLGLGVIMAGFGLRKFNRKARIGAGIVGTVALIAFPIGTLLGAYVLYLLFAPKGRTVFSDEYRHARELTPHLKYRPSIIVQIGSALLVAVLILVLLMAAGGMPD